MTDQVEISFVGGPLGRTARMYDVPSPAQIEQPYAIEANPRVAEVHIYKVARLYGAATWHGMELRYRYSNDGIGASALEFGPGRDEYNDVMHDEHRARMAEFLRRLELLQQEFGVEVEFDGCFECGGEAWWTLGNMRERVDAREVTS